MAEDMGDDIVVWAPNQPEVVGKAQVREWQRAWEGVSFESYDLSVDEILGCGDLAVVKGSYSMVVTMPGAPEPMSDSGRWIHVLRKTPTSLPFHQPDSILGCGWLAVWEALSFRSTTDGIQLLWRST